MENKNTCLSEKTKAMNMFGWNNKRYKGIFIAYISMLIITFPLIELILLLQSKSKTPIDDYAQRMENIAPGISGTVFAFIVILFTTIFVIVEFSYMHNKRCMDLFGSFPVSRRTLFFSRYFSVLAQTLIPLIVVGLAGAILTLKMATFINVMQTVAYLCLGVIGNVSFIALLSLCCGTVVDVIISFLAINGIYPICILICTLLPGTVLPGYGVSRAGINWSLYTLFSPAFAPFAGIWGYDTKLYVVWWIVFSMILLVGCYIFSKKRKTETAQNAFVFVIVEQVIKLFAGCVVGFGMGWLLALIGSGSNSSYRAQYIWFFVGVCIGSFVMGIILHLIYHRGLSKIKMSMLVSCIDVVIIFVFVMIIVTGAFGYDKRIPDVDEIQEVSVNMDDSYMVNGKDVRKNYTNDQKLIKAAVEAHKIIVKDKLKKKKGIYPMFSETEESDMYIVSHINISYKLKNGKTINRVYEGNFAGEKIEQLVEYAEDAVNEKQLLKAIPDDELTGVWLGDTEKGYSIDLMDCEYSILSRKEIRKLTEALIKDYDIVDKEKIRQKDVVYTISFSYNNSRNQYIGFSCDVTKAFKNTLDILKNADDKNTDLIFLEQDFTPYFEPVEFTGKNEKTVYFKVPEDWDKKVEIRAVLYSYFSSDWLVEQHLDEAVTKCEKVKDNIWKYTYSLPKDMEWEEFSEEYTKIVFYQILDDGVNLSGAIKIPKESGKQCLILKKKKRGKDIYNYDWAMYQYRWEKLK